MIKSISKLLSEDQTTGIEFRIYLKFHSIVASERGGECPSHGSVLISLRNALVIFRRLLFYKIAIAQFSWGSYLPQI